MLGVRITQPRPVVGLLHQPLRHHYASRPHHLPHSRRPVLPAGDTEEYPDSSLVSVWSWSGVSTTRLVLLRHGYC